MILIRFSALSRFLHWAMALMIIAMMVSGLLMVSTESPWYHRLLSLHRPLGIAILVLVTIRLINRLTVRVPPLPESVPPIQQVAAKATHWLLYICMFLLPLVGWGMLSAGDYPVVMWAGVTLPPILPHNTALFAALRQLHTVLAFTLIATVLAHIGAALLHGIVLRDGVFPAMASLKWGRFKTDR